MSKILNQLASSEKLRGDFPKPVKNKIGYSDWVNETFEKEIGRIYRVVIDRTERLLIEKALQRAQGNQLVAAKLLGLNRNTLRSKIKKLHIETQRFRS